MNRGAGLITNPVCCPVATFHSQSSTSAGGYGSAVEALRDSVGKYVAAIHAAIFDPVDLGDDHEIQNPFFMINRAEFQTPAPLMWLIDNQITLDLVGTRRRVRREFNQGQVQGSGGPIPGSTTTGVSSGGAGWISQTPALAGWSGVANRDRDSGWNRSGARRQGLGILPGRRTVTKYIRYVDIPIWNAAGIVLALESQPVAVG